jgi:hypothetical protein
VCFFIEGADISKNDGIYSRIYIAPKVSGSYHVTFIVSSGGSGSVFRKEETASVVNDGINISITIFRIKYTKYDA